MKQLILLFTLFSFNAFAQPVDINQADAKTISQSLHGIGQKKAEEIIKYRNQNGPFKTAKDLVKVKGVGAKTIEKNQKDIIYSQAKVSKDKI